MATHPPQPGGGGGGDGAEVPRSRWVLAVVFDAVIAAAFLILLWVRRGRQGLHLAPRLSLACWFGCRGCFPRSPRCARLPFVLGMEGISSFDGTQVHCAARRAEASVRSSSSVQHGVYSPIRQEPDGTRCVSIVQRARGSAVSVKLMRSSLALALFPFHRLQGLIVTRASVFQASVLGRFHNWLITRTSEKRKKACLTNASPPQLQTHECTLFAALTEAPHRYM